MNLLANLDHLYDECKRNQGLRYFAVFCRVALALGFIPSGIVKVIGERFTGLLRIPVIVSSDSGRNVSTDSGAS